MAARSLALLVSLLAAFAVAGCETASEAPKGDAPAAVKKGERPGRRGGGETPAAPPAGAGTALAALEHLRVKGRAPKTGYDRDEFGPGWVLIDGCDMRERMLARDLRRVAYEPGDDCEVASGVLRDPYTATEIQFRGDAREIDIDHVVALGDAWQKGAQQWSYRRRVAFANDPLNLLAADASANRSKGDGDAATWLPPNKAFRCEYVARQIAVKRRYRAWVTAAEKAAMDRVLARCADTRLPRSPRPRITIRKPGPGRVFENCDAVRAAGLDPLERGDGIYERNTHMDGDGDGMACE
jgi:uncharacterized protein DUF1524/excalibur calcium-binding domain-containing protein